MAGFRGYGWRVGDPLPGLSLLPVYTGHRLFASDLSVHRAAADMYMLCVGSGDPPMHRLGGWVCSTSGASLGSGLFRPGPSSLIRPHPPMRGHRMISALGTPPILAARLGRSQWVMFERSGASTKTVGVVRQQKHSTSCGKPAACPSTAFVLGRRRWRDQRG
jgi:hypothetical protein